MRNFLMVAVNVDVMPVLHDLFMHDELWNQHRYRTTFEGTPHIDVDDILVRFSPPTMNKRDDVYNDSSPVWYPEAVRALPSIKPVVLSLMARVQGCNLGRVLVTRIRPGGRILPHIDNEGSYCAQDIMRYHIVLQGAPGSLFRCGEDTIAMKTGEVWSFRSNVEHEVLNNSAEDRIHLIADMTFWS